MYVKIDCKPLQLWLLSRHGTRHPEANVIDQISSLEEYTNKITGKSNLCKEDIEAIRNWRINITKNNSNELNSQGVIDLSTLGTRLRNIYKDIFNEPFNHKTFKVLVFQRNHAIL